MWQTYSKASLVMVWLGDLSEDADLALVFLLPSQYNLSLIHI